MPNILYFCLAEVKMSGGTWVKLPFLTNLTGWTSYSSKHLSKTDQSSLSNIVYRSH